MDGQKYYIKDLAETSVQYDKDSSYLIFRISSQRIKCPGYAGGKRVVSSVHKSIYFFTNVLIRKNGTIMWHLQQQIQ